MQNIILKKPEWLKIRPPTTDRFARVKEIIKLNHLNTVCQEAHCPNTSECWSIGTATFMVLGDTCTRTCKFCAVKTGNPMKKLDKDEPKKLAKALAEIRLFDYVVLTSVTRDDLEDGGASHFAECVREIKKSYPKIIIEVLIQDFNGKLGAIKKIVDAKPEVIAHNIETVERLQKVIRDPRANYNQSLNVLKNVKKLNSKIYTKSSLMLGVGEKDEEVIRSMKDLRQINVDLLTIGQYLKPKGNHIQIEKFIEPEKFNYFKNKALESGFKFCAAGPFVRSSYRAGEFFVRNLLKKEN